MSEAAHNNTISPCTTPRPEPPSNDPFDYPQLPTTKPIQYPSKPGITRQQGMIEIVRNSDYGEEMPRDFIEELREHFATTEELEKLEDVMSPENFLRFKGYSGAENNGFQPGARPRLCGVPVLSRSRLYADVVVDHSRESHELMKAEDCDNEVECLGSKSRFIDSDSQLPDQFSVPDTLVDTRLSPRQSFVSLQSGHQVVRHPGNPSHHTRQVSQFNNFLELPPELRKHIYEIALYTGKEIHPMLCDNQYDGSIRFHDDNQHSRLRPNHNAIYNLLGVTWVSKQIREESLPCFYSANTIAITEDTATYFAHLERLNRFHMIRHVRLCIPLLTERWTAQLLEQMSTYVKNVEKYESQHASSDDNFAHGQGMMSNMPMRDNYAYLVEHPRYIAGGLNEMALFICLRMLTSAFLSSNSGGYTSSLTLPIPSVASFTSYARLRWFPLSCRGLGIHVRYLEGHELVHNHVRFIVLDWHQKFQKKEFDADAGRKVDVDVRQRTLEMYPDVDKREMKLESCVYMRRSCNGDSCRWYKVMHDGNKASGRVD